MLRYKEGAFLLTNSEQLLTGVTLWFLATACTFSMHASPLQCAVTMIHTMLSEHVCTKWGLQSVFMNRFR